VYGVDDVTALSGLAHEKGLKVHMDGARFANAVAHLGCSPADITWKAGIDALSFGATKNGAMAAEAAIFFDPALAAGFEERRMRGGHLLSKMRFLSAQLEAYVADDLWLRLARHANRMATLLADAVMETPGADFLHPVDGDEVFVRFGDVTVVRRLADSGVAFVPWAPREGIIRLVASFQTTEDEVRQFRAALQHAVSVAG
jgi:threonine aldolase